MSGGGGGGELRAGPNRSYLVCLGACSMLAGGGWGGVRSLTNIIPNHALIIRRYRQADDGFKRLIYMYFCNVTASTCDCETVEDVG